MTKEQFKRNNSCCGYHCDRLYLIDRCQLHGDGVIYVPQQGAVSAPSQCLQIDRQIASFSRIIFSTGFISRLGDHGYPKSLIKRRLKRVKYPAPKTEKIWRATVSIPYVKEASKGISRILNNAGIRVTYKRGRLLRILLTHLKDKTPSGCETNCLHKINCKGCSGVYIEQTSRELSTRISEHKNGIGKQPRNSSEYQTRTRDSALAEHVLDTGHSVDLDNVEVIRRGIKPYVERLHAEAVEITRLVGMLSIRRMGLISPQFVVQFCSG